MPGAAATPYNNRTASVASQSFAPLSQATPNWHQWQQSQFDQPQMYWSPPPGAGPYGSFHGLRVPDAQFVNNMPTSMPSFPVHDSDAASPFSDSECGTYSSIDTHSVHTANSPLGTSDQTDVQNGSADHTLTTTTYASQQARRSLDNQQILAPHSEHMGTGNGFQTSSLPRVSDHTSTTPSLQKPITSNQSGTNVTQGAASQIDYTSLPKYHAGQRALCALPAGCAPLNTSHLPYQANLPSPSTCYEAKHTEPQRRPLNEGASCISPQPAHESFATHGRSMSYQPPANASHAGYSSNSASFGPLMNAPPTYSSSTTQPPPTPQYYSGSVTSYPSIGPSYGPLTNSDNKSPTPVKKQSATLPRNKSGGITKDHIRDTLLVEWKRRGLTYRDIKWRGGFAEAESTLRGRFRNLTKDKKRRVRKPNWEDLDVCVPFHRPYTLCISLIRSTSAVAYHCHHSRTDHANKHLALQLRLLNEAVDLLSPPQTTTSTRDSSSRSRIPWKKVAEYIVKHGGSYHFGNSTCKKKWDAVYKPGVRGTGRSAKL